MRRSLAALTLCHLRANRFSTNPLCAHQDSYVVSLLAIKKNVAGMP